MVNKESGSVPKSPILQELKKRRRELFYVIPLSVLFLVLTWIELRLFGMSQSLPFVHSIFFFGLVNFNIVILLLLVFLIFRNLVKGFVEKRQGLFGGTLKSKLVMAFAAFSIVPTILMFLISVFYINNSFDKWFSEKMAGVLKSSLEVTNAYYLSAKKRNYHFAEVVAQNIGKVKNDRELERTLSHLREQFSLDSVEYYPGLFGKRLLAISKDDAVPQIPPVNLEFLKKGVRQKVDASTIHPFESGNLIRVIVPVNDQTRNGAIVVSSFIPLSLISKMNDIALAYEDFRDVNPLEYPLKSIYLIILILMTMVILLGGTWFGFHLAKQLSIPLEDLSHATSRVAQRDYSAVTTRAGSAEINELISHFNSMTENLDRYEREAREANQNLTETLGQLDKHSRYMEVVLSNVSTGVISIDAEDRVTTINNHAAQLLEIKPDQFIGKPFSEILTPEYSELVIELIQSIKSHQAKSIQKEIRLNIAGHSMPLQISLSLLLDDQGVELGKVLVFDDLTPVLRAQRAAAWTEVARRIAHEIKNPLTPIRLSAQRLQKKFSSQIEDEAFEQCVTMIIDQVDNLKHLVNEFSSFARLPRSQPVKSSLNKVVEDIVVLFRSAHRNIHLDFHADSTLPEFWFDPDQMKRVVTNLLDNSLAAVKGEKHGGISVTTQYDSLLKIARLVVADNGAGIAETVRDRIFDPYVTTKENGTGLGLAIVKRTVEDHNGYIRAFANTPRGTKMVIELPVTDHSNEKNLATPTPDSGEVRA